VQSDSIDVRYVARLARIALTDEEVDRFSEQLVALLGHVDALSELDTNIVAATAQVVESRNVTRADEPRPWLDRATVLEQAPRSQGNFFRVPRIIAE
jgi:aspartyl-tRNA(Asn)/glutamyl-tRNA(Gln) amidotransferase subunit C